MAARKQNHRKKPRQCYSSVFLQEYSWVQFLENYQTAQPEAASSSSSSTNPPPVLVPISVNSVCFFGCFHSSVIHPFYLLPAFPASGPDLPDEQNTGNGMVITPAATSMSCFLNSILEMTDMIICSQSRPYSAIWSPMIHMVFRLSVSC